MSEQFSRSELIYGAEAMEKLRRSRVIVFGVGGVGGYVVEGLARSGIGNIDLVDSDRIVLSNLNRQIISLHDNIGEYKTDAAEKRIHSINPDCAVNTYHMFYLPETADEIDLSGYDYIIDAVDTVKAKLFIAENAYRLGVPVISSMGAGGKIYPQLLEVADIYKTSVCPLARVMRYELRKLGVKKLKVVYSRESAVWDRTNDTVEKKVIGSAVFVPAAAGMIIASEVVNDICGMNKQK